MSQGKPTYNNDSINDLILRSPGLRTSPDHLRKLNNGSHIIEFKPSYVAKGDPNGYRIFLTGYADYLLKLERQYGDFTLQKNINALRARPRPMECGFRNPGSVDTWVVNGDKHYIYYKVSNGQILVFNITLRKSTWKARAKEEEAALYKVTLKPDGSWARQRVARIVTQYAAINGILNNLNKATWLMAQHLSSQFKPEAIKEFTLFHNPSRGAVSDAAETLSDLNGKTTDISKQFAEVLVQTQNYGDPVKWIAHSQGGLIFKQAVKWLNNGRQDQEPEGKHTVAPLDKHSVAFRAAPVHDSSVKKHMQDANIKIIGIVSHPDDAVYKILGFNTINPISLFKSVANLSHTMGGTPMTSVHTLAPDKATLKQTRKQYPMYKGPTNIDIDEHSGFGDAGCKHKPYTFKSFMPTNL